MQNNRAKKIITYVSVGVYLAFILWVVFSLVRSQFHKEREVISVQDIKASSIEPNKEQKPVVTTKNEIDFIAAEETDVSVDTQVQPAVTELSVVEEKVIETEEVVDKNYMSMLYQTSAKTYMDYRAITDTSSAQYNLIHSDVITICEDGFLRDADGFIGVAMGSYFGEIGSRYIINLDNGNSFGVIKVEAKADIHTIDTFCGYMAYDIIEFVIDTQANWMKENTWSNNYIFSGNFNNCEMFKGKIVSIEKVEN